MRSDWLARRSGRRERDGERHEGPGHRHRWHRHQGCGGRHQEGRARSPTGSGSLRPEPATPEAVAEVVVRSPATSTGTGPIGCTFPGVVKGGTVHTAANLDQSWIGVDAATLFGEATGCPVTVMNDADAAGVAESRASAPPAARRARHRRSPSAPASASALIIDGRLVPNTELGHLILHGGDAEKYAAELGPRARRARLGRVGVHGSASTSAWSRTCCGPTCSWSAAAFSKKADKFLPS